MMIRTTLLTDVRDPDPTDLREDWSDFCHRLLNPPSHKHDEDRTDLPTFTVGYRHAEATGRRKSDFDGAYLLVYDFDGAPEDDVVDMAAALAEDGTAAALYSSWNNGHKTPELWRGRLIVPLFTPVAAADLGPLHDAVLAHYGSPALRRASDGGAKNLSHNFAMPAKRGLVEPEVEVVLGEALRPADWEKEDATPDPHTAAELVQVSKNRLRQYGEDIARQNDGRQPAAMDLIGLCNGERFGEPGERNQRAHDIVKLIGDRWPHADPDHIEGLFDDVINDMGADLPGEWHDLLNTHLGNAAEGARRQQEAREEYNIERSFEMVGIERTTPYSVEELKEWCEAAGVKPKEFKRRLILQAPKAFYIWFHGHYYQANYHTAGSMARQLLAACVDWGIETTVMKRKAQVNKSAEALVDDYGTVIHNVKHSIAHEVSEYDSKTLTLTLPACTIRTDIEPEYNELVDGWLKAMCKTTHDYQALNTWLAWVTHLENPLRLLYLRGGRKVGKSLFFMGVSRVWSRDGYCEMKEATDTFNAKLLYSPLIVADEELPPKMRTGYTGELREMVSKTMWRVNRKNQDLVTLHGAMRIILAANHERMIFTKENLSVDDIEAINERILYIHIQDQAREYLEEKLGGFAKVNQLFIKQDALAKHVLWLNTRREHYPMEGRFLVGEGSEVVTGEFTFDTGIRPGIFEWVESALMSPAKLEADSGAARAMVYRYDKLWLSPKALTDNWTVYLKYDERNRPNMTTVGTTLKGLSKEPRRKLMVNGKRGWYRCLDIEQLRGWCHSRATTPWEEIEERLETLKEDDDAENAKRGE